MRISTDIYRVAGATAIFSDRSFKRRLCDALTAGRQVHGRVDHYENIGRYLLDLEPDSYIFL